MITTNLNVYLLLEKYCQKNNLNEYTSSQLSKIQCVDLYQNDLASEKTKIFSQINSDAENLEILDAWINVYHQNDFNELHDCSSEEYMSKCDFTGIIILDCGKNENLIIVDQQNQSQFFNINPGQLYIINNQITRGLDTVKEKIITLVFMLKS
jgi:hypothetical protein